VIQDSEEDAVERPLSLNEQRLASVIEVIRSERRARSDDLRLRLGQARPGALERAEASNGSSA